MIDRIRDGISLALAGAFPHCRVYGDQNVSQGLEPPCFFIQPAQWSTGPLPGGMRRVRLPVEVAYFPLNEGDYGELWAAGTAALELLGELAVDGGGPVRGTGLHCTVSDGLMHISAVYEMRLSPVEEAVVMGELTVHSRSGG